jgi:hypothetical protein
MRRLFVILLLLAHGAILRAGDDTPAWLKEAASQRTTRYPSKVPAVDVIRDTTMTVSENGRTVTAVRVAVKVLTKEGRSQAIGLFAYLSGTGKVREARAWMLPSSGEVIKIGKESIVDRPNATGNAYEDVRVRQIDGRGKADAGSVFGYEFVGEDVFPFTQREWLFQDRNPVLASRFTLVLPPGWEVKGTMIHHAAKEPQTSGSSYSWELRELPYLEPEPGSPSFLSMVPRLAVSYFPATPSKASTIRSFASWQDVSKWSAELSDPQAEPTDPIRAKAAELVRGKSTEFQRIQAIASYLQSVRYISIQTGLSRGGGYKPRSAADTFTKQYGDCKDKSTLMRAFLKAAGIDSHIVLIHSNDRSYVQEEWPSPEQFNHAIVAIKISPDTRAAAVLDHPSLGRLLIFDPTNLTYVGDLPRLEQGSLALIAAGDKGSLVRMPETPAAYNLVEREIRGALDGTGGLHAKIHNVAHGANAAGDRGRFWGTERDQYLNTLEKWVSRGSPGAVASRILPRDDMRSTFSIDAELDAPQYAQIKGSGLIVFKPSIVNRREGVSLTEPERTWPIVFEAQALREAVYIAIPQGFKVDELPDPAKLETPFGKYTAAFEVKNGEVVFTRAMEIRPTVVPAAQYGKVREFYERILAVEQSPVVLVRQ